MVYCKAKTTLTGKTIIVTGANTGIGYEAALDFAQRGARVILACRDSGKAEEARKKIIEETGNDNVVVRILDLSSFASVRKFAEDINKTEDRLDILVNNAGVGAMGEVKTEDGNLLVMQVNHLSHFLLTNLLIGLLKNSAPSRIVNVSSDAAKGVSLNTVDLNESVRCYITLYSRSKLCNVLFTIELAERLKGTGVTAYSLHPGAIKTELARDITGVMGLVLKAAGPWFKTSEEGAQTTIYTAVAPGIEEDSGGHFQECQKIKRYRNASDPELPKKLWEVSENMVGLKTEELQF